MSGIFDVIARSIANSGFHSTTLYDDINFEGTSLATGNSAPDLVALYGTGNILGRAFDGGNTMEQLFGGGEILHFYKEGEDIYPHIHWMPTTTNTGNVKWNLEYSWFNAKDDIGQPTVNTISVIDSAGGAAWIPHAIEFPSIDGTGKRIGSHFRFRLYRDPNDVEDTYPDDAVLDSIGLHVPINSNGSRQRFVK